MATWILGDVHGCMAPLRRLLDEIGFDPSRDEIVQVGDLSNKGPETLEVLRWAMALGDRFEMVLGNHDLHLLARAVGARRPRREDTFDDVLEAPDRGELLQWLVSRPLFIRRGDIIVVHAGLMPGWSTEDAEAEACRCEEALKAGVIAELTARKDLPWSPELEGVDRTAAALAVLTRIRMIDAEGRPDLESWGPPAAAPTGYRPWFEDSAAIGEGKTVVFGHWATLGLFRAPGVICLDSGCVYGGALSALCVEDGRLVQVESGH